MKKIIIFILALFLFGCKSNHVIQAYDNDIGVSKMDYDRERLQKKLDFFIQKKLIFIEKEKVFVDVGILNNEEKLKEFIVFSIRSMRVKDLKIEDISFDIYEDKTKEIWLVKASLKKSFYNAYYDFLIVKNNCKVIYMYYHG